MNSEKPKCICCGKPGEVAQCPWRFAYSTCHCSLCWELESIAYGVFRDMFPSIMKQSCPLPFLKGVEDIPSEWEEMSLEDVQDFFKKKF